MGKERQEEYNRKTGKWEKQWCFFFSTIPVFYHNHNFKGLTFKNILKKEVPMPSQRKSTGNSSLLQLPNHFLLPSQHSTSFNFNISGPPGLSSSKDNTGKQSEYIPDLVLWYSLKGLHPTEFFLSNRSITSWYLWFR